MAENVAITPGTGDSIGADDIAGVKYQRVKLIHGADGTNDGDVSSANGLPVQGTVTANLGATDNAVLDTIDAVLDEIKVDTEAIETAVEAIQAGQLADSHNVTVDNASIAVTNAGITSIDGKTPALGQALAAASVPVILPAATITTLTPPAAISGFATSAKQDTLDTSVNTLLKPASTLAAVTSITNVVHVDDNAGSLTVDGTVTANLSATDNGVLDDISTDTGNIDTKLGTIDADTSNIVAGYATEGSALGSGILMQGDDGTDRTNVLVDAAGHLQVDVLTMPAGGSGLTDAELRATPVPVSGTVTANLSATDNAVLDTIDSVLDTINAKLVTGTVIGDVNLGATDNAVLDTIAAKDFATQTTLAAINAKMVTGTDIGDVTINNASGAGAVNIQDGGNSITVDGAVTVDMGANNDVTVTGTVDLGATDNAVLDTIDAVLDTVKIDTAALVVDAAASEVLLGTIDADTGGILTAVQLIDNAVDGNYLNTNMNIAGADVSGTVPVPTRLADYEFAGVTSHVKKYYANTGAATDGIIWSPAAGKRWYVTDIFVGISAAATITLEDDLTAGDSIVWAMDAAANSGWSHHFSTPLFSGEDAADLMVTTTAGNVKIMVTGYEI